MLLRAWPLCREHSLLRLVTKILMIMTTALRWLTSPTPSTPTQRATLAAEPRRCAYSAPSTCLLLQISTVQPRTDPCPAANANSHYNSPCFPQGPPCFPQGLPESALTGLSFGSGMQPLSLPCSSPTMHCSFLVGCLHPEAACVARVTDALLALCFQGISTTHNNAQAKKVLPEFGASAVSRILSEPRIPACADLLLAALSCDWGCPSCLPDL